MRRSIVILLLLGALGLAGVPAIRAADQPATVETQLRERLRDTLLQLRAAETDRATLQAAQTQSAEEKKALTEKVEAITKEANANRLAAQPVEGLKTQVASLEKEIAQLKETIENVKQTAEAAHTQDTERAKRAEDAVIDLQRLLVDRQAKNLALYKVACEILQRYQQFSLGEALKAREPFVGVTRVKLQNLVQDYQDKIQDQRTTLKEKDLEPPPHADKSPSQPQAANPDSSARKQTPE
jgi:hypothetical protein